MHRNFGTEIIYIIFQTKTHAGMSMMPMTMETEGMEEMEGAAEIAEVRRKKRSTSSSILSEATIHPSPRYSILI